jgi:hypothetical protein
MAKKKNSKSAPWDRPNPRKKAKKLSPKAKSAAKARARRAGRKYPNLVDNMRAARSR